jgi:hypothetical protein
MPLQKASDSKTVAVIKEEVPQHTTQMKLYVLSAVYIIAEASRLITPTVIKTCILRCGFSVMSETMLILQ